MSKAKKQSYQQIDVIPPACLKCGSTSREKYHNVRAINSTGIRDGRDYNRITLKRTRCKDCGQHRVDRVFEYDPTLSASRTAAATKKKKSGVKLRHGNPSGTSV